LTAPVRGQLNMAVEIAAAILDGWGATCLRRAQNEAVEPLLGDDIDMMGYETRDANAAAGE